MECYIDESGDLGFKKENATRHFIITLLVARNPKEIRNCIKRIRQKRLKKKYKIPELKFSSSSQLIKRRVLEVLSKKDIEIYAIVLNIAWKNNTST